MPRVEVFNHRRRNLGTFRATATTRDHGPGGCDCGGPCCADKPKLRIKPSKDVSYYEGAYEFSDMAIDVKYSKGVMGSKTYATRHYVIPDNMVDPRGYPPQAAYVMNKLRENSDHRAMIRNGWAVEDVEGYYKPSTRRPSR